jgi:nicotinate phosphoribosyltransferase
MNLRPPVSLWPDPAALGALTDLYELTMIAGYYSAGMAEKTASFELFVRKLPQGRSYLMFAGLEQALGDLLGLACSPEQIEALRRWPEFRDLDASIIARLASMRFEGDVWSVPEGTVVFAGETLLRVTAPLPQAQWVETHLLASLTYPTSVALKAARIVTAAGGRSLYEFGARRGHGPGAVLLAARSAYLAGFAGTSHVEAARRLGIPASGTMAHSWVQSFATESQAFQTYARVFPESTTLLVDTYDTLEGVRRAAELEAPIQAIRIDSGDIGSLAVQSRAILDRNDRASVKIIASGDLDEHKIAALVSAGAPIDGFGVGSELVTCRDAPSLAMVYKLVELDGVGRFKLSPGKKTYPMAKQVFRRHDRSGEFLGDHITRADETADGEPLLIPVIRSGRLVQPLPALDTIRARCRDQLSALPERLRALDAKADYPITYSDVLEADARRLTARGGE